MLNKDYANVTSAIGARTLQPAAYKSQPNWGLMLAQGVNAYNEQQSANERAKQLGAYGEALKEQHPEDAARIDAMGALEAGAYYDALKKEQQKRQWELEDMARKEQFERSMAMLRHKNAMQTAAANAAGGATPIMNNPFTKKMVENFAKDYNESVKKAQQTYDEYANADRLLDKIDTGGKYAVPAIANFAAITNPDVSEFIAAQNKLIPTMRPTGSGSTSDKDMAIFAKATFGIGKPKEANRNIIRGRMAAAENERDYQQLMAQWINGGGNPIDFENEWNQYLEMNPIFSSEDGTLNKTRVSGRNWFLQNQNSQTEQIPVGTIEDGYRFKGGNPSDPNNWEEVR